MVNIRQYNAEEIIIKEGDTGESVYIIKEGRVNVTKEVDGKEVHIAYIKAGQIFGEMSMIDMSPQFPYTPFSNASACYQRIWLKSCFTQPLSNKEERP